MKYTQRLRDRIKELETHIEQVYKAGYYGIQHVGRANYASREREAISRLQKVYHKNENND